MGIVKNALDSIFPPSAETLMKRGAALAKYNDEKLEAREVFNPTSKIAQEPVDPNNPFSSLGIGLKIGSFNFGIATAQDTQKGEKIDYSAFLIQAGTLLRTNKFMCTVFLPSYLARPTSNRAMTYACEAVSIPPQTIETMDYRMNMMPSVKAPVMRNFGNEITLTFRMYGNNNNTSQKGLSFGISSGDFGLGISAGSQNQRANHSMEPRASMLKWQNSIVDFEGEFAGASYFDEFSADSTIIVSQLDTASNVVHNMEFINAYPTVVEGLSYAWEDPGQYLKQNITFAFSRVVDSYYTKSGGPFDSKKSGLGIGEIFQAISDIATGDLGGIANTLGLGGVLSGNGTEGIAGGVRI